MKEAEVVDIQDREGLTMNTGTHAKEAKRSKEADSPLESPKGPLSC
jgi:hypothetical protein